MSMSGSSPLARGLLDIHAGDVPGRGIIPACAGFTILSSFLEIGRRDHPRLRGVYASEYTEKLHLPRIIPACAGFTEHRRPLLREDSDHPRLRGVYSYCIFRLWYSPGSSPLARGLLSSFLDTGRSFGIIPACAGFTIMVGEESMRARDHPRLRGVYRGWRVDGWRVPGSSPLARGLRYRTGYSWDNGGIIPACAGFTDAGYAREDNDEDHPRLRGVYRARD